MTNGVGSHVIHVCAKPCMTSTALHTFNRFLGHAPTVELASGSHTRKQTTGDELQYTTQRCAPQTAYKIQPRHVLFAITAAAGQHSPLDSTAQQGRTCMPMLCRLSSSSMACRPRFKQGTAWANFPGGRRRVAARQHTRACTAPVGSQAYCQGAPPICSTNCSIS